MEGDAKGQVGGMEMDQKERERLASESRAWKCQGCGGRSNEDILTEEGGEAGEDKSIEPPVPEDLKFGFRDLMGSSEHGKTANTEREPSQPVDTPAAGQAASSSGTVASEAPINPAETPLQSPYINPVPPQPTIGPPRVSHSIPAATPSNGVPPWVDKAITGLVAALAVMVVKKIVL
jgi:ubiquitin-conjugating enzyme E2 J1